MKRRSLLIISLIMILSVFCLAGCNVNTSGYMATGYVKSNTTGSAHMSFSSFKGSDSFSISSRSGSAKELKYSGKLESGNITVYYETDGTKKELFSLKGGEEIDSSLSDLGKGTVKITLDTEEKCKGGKFDFKFE
ncbi:hypothetical protein [Ruminococcus flavefaciens]|uniref:Lipoprotein n=1 Tax=Ruminococcus flavefaciens 007c TaxID=1341157 RepID=W7UEU8_RUMFL|nr:hypothetical protein [Ruminococcus flavefaciens]EWM52463.1 hypothetical protein RF007C_07960 [Ruminococcus flavefaciens 007c]